MLAVWIWRAMGKGVDEGGSLGVARVRKDRITVQQHG